MADVPDDPAVQVEQRIAEARREFAIDVDLVLDLFDQLVLAASDVAPGAYLSSTAGQRYREEGLRALRQFLLTKFDQRVWMRGTGDPQLLQLIREAFDYINDPASKVDLRDWTKEARKVLG